MNRVFVKLLFISLYALLFLADARRIKWQWTCDTSNSRCLKEQASIFVSNKDYKGGPSYPTLELCRLTCGRYGALWPMPTIRSFLGKTLIPIHSDSFKIVIENKNVEGFINKVVEIFKKNIVKQFGINLAPVSTVVHVSVSIRSDSTKLNEDTDEYYAIGISTEDQIVSVKISSGSVYGARHAFETLLQLMASNTQATPTELMMLNAATIEDKPIYKHRGLLLDSARNFLSLQTIKRQIDGMACSKLNVFHWHATDSQSFPLVFPSVPQLASYGAYSANQTYSFDEIAELISYAELRGVRLLLEIDAPAHAGNGWQWGPSEGLGDLAVCVNKLPWRSYCIEAPCGQLNPINPNVYEVLKKMYKDIVEVFPDNQMFHMGGDEVFFPCWNSSLEIVEHLASNGKTGLLEDYMDMWGQFHIKALKAFDDAARNSNTRMVLWSSELTRPEIISNYLPSDRYTIQTWVPAANDLPQKLLSMGYHLIISTKDAWYLDHGFWGNTQYHVWRTVYTNRISRHKNITGGEVCSWGEFVGDSSLDSRNWPRAAAAAERLWSDPDTTSLAAEARFYQQRERLISRGIRCEAVTPRWCYQNEGGCI